MKNWSKWIKYLQKIYLYIKISFCLIFIKIALFLLKLSTFRKCYSFFTKATATQKIYSESYIKHHVYAIERIAPYFHATCLPKALTLKYFLRNDVDFLVKIGVSKDNNVFESHAWVEKNSKIVIGRTTETYVPLWTW